MASLQRRVGPTFVGIYGLLQPVADAVKLLSKELIIPTKTASVIFLLSPLYTFTFGISGWLVIPFITISGAKSLNWLDFSVTLFLFLFLTSLFSYGIIFAGWSSNNQYALISIVRYIGQTLSYELSFGILLLNPILIVNSWNLLDITLYQLFQLKCNLAWILPFHVILFFIVILIKTNRIPFDLAEAESELIAGYHVEHSGVNLLFILVSEYSQILIVGLLMVTFFFGYSISTLTILGKLTLINFLFISVRAAYPRVRYDQLLFFAWKYIFPISFSLLMLYLLLKN
jgi:NADH-quinone oxidoreductase subunit H